MTMRLADWMPGGPAGRLLVGAQAVELAPARAEQRRLAPSARAPLASLDAEAVRAAIGRLLAQHRAPAYDVIVEAGLAHLWLLPFHRSLTGEARWRNYAQARFEQAFGDSQAWEIRVAAACPPHDRLAVAVPVSLMTGLRHALGRSLRRVRIDAIERLNALLRTESRLTGAAIDVGECCAWLFLFRGGVLNRVRRRQFIDAPVPDLAASIAAGLRSEWSVIAEDTLPDLRLAWGRADPRDLCDRLRAALPAAQAFSYG